MSIFTQLVNLCGWSLNIRNFKKCSCNLKNNFLKIGTYLSRYICKFQIMLLTKFFVEKLTITALDCSFLIFKYQKMERMQMNSPVRAVYWHGGHHEGTAGRQGWPLGDLHPRHGVVPKFTLDELNNETSSVRA